MLAEVPSRGIRSGVGNQTPSILENRMHHSILELEV